MAASVGHSACIAGRSFLSLVSPPHGDRNPKQRKWTHPLCPPATLALHPNLELLLFRERDLGEELKEESKHISYFDELMHYLGIEKKTQASTTNLVARRNFVEVGEEKE
jgi:hypothetical protein